MNRAEGVDGPAGAHEWVSFDDPSDQRTWLVDVTFLESAWQCLYGHGCPGVLTARAPELEQGCCSYGAHFTGEDDAERVRSAAAGLTEEQWQFRSVSAGRGGPLRGGPLRGGQGRGGQGRDGQGRGGQGRAVTTRLVQGACIFLNRPGYHGGAGCALHRAALERGVAPLSLKPDVCWQLPLRRDESVAPDGQVTTTIGEWQRRHWGPGGADFAWWCTESAGAFSGPRPLYEAMKEELVEMMGSKPYELIARFLDARRIAGARGLPVRLPHPAVRHHGR